jgi:hypothetical protein
MFKKNLELNLALCVTETKVWSEPKALYSLFHMNLFFKIWYLILSADSLPVWIGNSIQHYIQSTGK